MFNPSRWRNVATARTLCVMLFMAGLGLLVSIIYLLFLSQSLLSSKINEMDTHRTAMSVDGAIQSSVSRVMTLVVDNAIWDDAVYKTYPPNLDSRWLYDTWGAGIKINNLYDGTFVLDEHFNIIWGAFHSLPYAGRDLSFFGRGIQALIGNNAAALASGQKNVAGITRTQEGIAFVSIGLIRPMNGRLQVKDATRRYLLITRHLNPQILRELGETFQIDSLHFTATNTSPYSIPLRSAAGDVVGYLNWQPRLPGAKAAIAASPQIRKIVILAAALILLFILLSSLGLYKLARGEKQARASALTDWLSHLPNRRALLERLEQESERGATYIKTVVFIDLDGFKDVNDIYGHDTGDALIVQVAGVLQTQVPEGGMLVRLGGDEFAMTVSGAGAAEQAMAFAHRALESLTAPIQIGSRTIYISASVGIASSSSEGETSSELFRRADIAMYHSKISGKGRITQYDAELDTAREHQLSIENEIRRGLERQEFDVWYQPIVDASTLAMTGVEALVCWPRRPQGELKPDAFIPIAESSGLIYALGQFVLRRACADLQPLGNVMLSVNISPAQFRDPDFENKVAQVLSACGFPPGRLQLEVTENYVLGSPERASAAIANLKAQGISVALDDFGTGYSSIGYLRQLAFDSIKIDKSLAGLVDCDEQATALVCGTVRIASALGMSAVAEGVETEEQMVLLRQAGCDRLQGYLFREPLPIAGLILKMQTTGWPAPEAYRESR
ncbi:diguanylate cyclase [Pluralibacter gergoviae]|uniref:putative bifunctional diguanylate cyclase/phosphodiesterase n=1 Tax=Pluralibacter gergoviae TaxID=61647 RepID=UPI0008DBFBF3|nr:bifunctional diguanylate cyclase/phosphodiesterase [Pluralibacter gergoviae]OHY70256.1 diguanylate cyclase [Pluralibacter gergoviae]